MKNKKIKNPLRRRVPRELLGDWRKYLVVSFFLILTIGFVSGMYVANESMMTSARQGIAKYRLEDGHFEFPSARFNPPPLGGQALAAFPSRRNCGKIQH